MIKRQAVISNAGFAGGEIPLYKAGISQCSK